VTVSHGSGLRVLIAPDSFKGSISAEHAAVVISGGWAAVRPQDRIVLAPQADGGEGTLDAVRTALPEAEVRETTVTLPDRTHQARWLLTTDGIAVVELAECCGLPLLGTGAPLTASTRPVGTVLRAALDAGAREILVGLGGSASTDGGAGCLAELGLRALDDRDHEVGDGGAALAGTTRIDRSALLPPPPGGVRLLADVTAPLFGPTGAAAIFGPQKGATPADVATLDSALRHWHALVGGDADAPGAGAAGGIGYGLASLWGARLTSGADAVAELTGLPAAIGAADVVITGEGRFDDQSLTGKGPGRIVERALEAGSSVLVIAGSIGLSDVPDGVRALGLTDLAGSLDAALAEPERWLDLAARTAAARTGH